MFKLSRSIKIATLILTLGLGILATAEAKLVFISKVSLTQDGVGYLCAKGPMKPYTTDDGILHLPSSQKLVIGEWTSPERIFELWVSDTEKNKIALCTPRSRPESGGSGPWIWVSENGEIDVGLNGFGDTYVYISPTHSKVQTWVLTCEPSPLGGNEVLLKGWTDAYFGGPDRENVFMDYKEKARSFRFVDPDDKTNIPWPPQPTWKKFKKVAIGKRDVGYVGYSGNNGEFKIGGNGEPGWSFDLYVYPDSQWAFRSENGHFLKAGDLSGPVSPPDTTPPSRPSGLRVISSGLSAIPSDSLPSNSGNRTAEGGANNVSVHLSESFNIGDSEMFWPKQTGQCTFTLASNLHDNGQPLYVSQHAPDNHLVLSVIPTEWTLQEPNDAGTLIPLPPGSPVLMTFGSWASEKPVPGFHYSQNGFTMTTSGGPFNFANPDKWVPSNNAVAGSYIETWNNDVIFKFVNDNRKLFDFDGIDVAHVLNNPGTWQIKGFHCDNEIASVSVDTSNTTRIDSKGIYTTMSNGSEKHWNIRAFRGLTSLEIRKTGGAYPCFDNLHFIPQPLPYPEGVEVIKKVKGIGWQYHSQVAIMQSNVGFLNNVDNHLEIKNTKGKFELWLNTDEGKENQIALKSDTGFVSVQDNGSIQVNRKLLDAWEVLTFEPSGGNSLTEVVLRGHTGGYIGGPAPGRNDLCMAQKNDARPFRFVRSAGTNIAWPPTLENGDGWIKHSSAVKLKTEVDEFNEPEKRGAMLNGGAMLTFDYDHFWYNDYRENLWELWINIKPGGEDNLAFKSVANGKWITVKPDGAMICTASYPAPQAWEVFKYTTTDIVDPYYGRRYPVIELTSWIGEKVGYANYNNGWLPNAPVCGSPGVPFSLCTFEAREREVVGGHWTPWPPTAENRTVKPPKSFNVTAIKCLMPSSGKSMWTEMAVMLSSTIRNYSTYVVSVRK